MRLSTLTAAAALAAFAASPAAAAVFTDLGTPNTDLSNLPTPDVASGTVEFRTGTVTNDYKSPYRDSDGNPLTGLDDAEYTSVQADSSATYNMRGSFLEILWGSPDDLGGGGLSPDASRNFISFFSSSGGAGMPFETVTAADLKSAPGSSLFDEAAFASDTSNKAEGFAWVRIALDESFESFTLVNDGSNAFEVDGVVTPLPAAAWLMIGGLGAVGAYARRARKAAPTA